MAVVSVASAVPRPSSTCDGLSARLGVLDELLGAAAALWRPMPFRVPRPAWLDTYPALAEVDRLGDAELGALRDDPALLQQWLGVRVTGLDDLATLSHVTPAAASPLPYGEHASRGVPGRKRAQVEAFAGAVAPLQAEPLEWCSGKGHLGRLLATTTGCTVTSLERDAALCQDGEALARRVGAGQRFVCGDALAPPAADLVRDRHVLALHACGDLHRTLAERAVTHAAAAVDIAPCCYHLSAQAEYRPFSPLARLRLTRDEMHLAVTETATAGERERRLRDRDAAWKHAFVLLRADACGGGYAPFPPVPGAWLRGTFAEFIARMAVRHAVPLPSAAVVAGYEARGWDRLAIVSRRELVRLAFRRVLELWLVADLGSRFEAHGYRCALHTFCTPQLTPRNLLLSARAGG